jgi:hypothetical protein
MRFRTFSVASAALTAWFKRPICSFEVPVFTAKPSQPSTTRSGKPCSTTVGTSFKSGTRFGAVTASARSLPVIRLAVKSRLPTILATKYFPAEGGLMAYASDDFEATRVAASYIDRILRGAKINELPVQFPTKFELIVNLRTAKAIGLTIPESFLLRADEVIE